MGPRVRNSECQPQNLCHELGYRCHSLNSSTLKLKTDTEWILEIMSQTNRETYRNEMDRLLV